MITKTLLKDVAERAVATAAQTFLALLTVSDLSSAKTAAAAGIAAGLSVLKGFAASLVPVGDKSASLVNAGYVEVIEVPVAPVKKATRKPATKKKAAD